MYAFSFAWIFKKRFTKSALKKGNEKEEEEESINRYTCGYNKDLHENYGTKIMSNMLNNFFMIFQFSNKLMLAEDNFIKYNQKPTNWVFNIFLKFWTCFQAI